MAAWSLTVLLLVSLTLPEPSRSLSEADKEDLIGAHNRYRSSVFDASSMMKMNWDKDLAEMAAVFAQECVWEHNSKRGNTGENLFMITGPIDLKKAVEKWYLEFTDYTYETMDCTPKKMCGHYTQLVWANSDKVGCGTHFCEEVEGLAYKNVSLLVCNYSPPGNIVGQRPYQKGTPCSECPDGTKCIANLCTSELKLEAEPKLEPTAESGTKQESTTEPETKLEPIEPETKLEPIEPETKLEPIEPETKLEPIEPETKLEPMTELETKLEPTTEPETKLEPIEPETKLEPTTEPETKLEPIEPETKLEPTTEPETKLEPIEPETKLDPTTEPETEQEINIELKTKPEPKMEPETTSKPAPKLDPQIKSKLTQGTDHKLESEIESDEAAKANGSLGLSSSTVLTFIVLLVLYSASS